MSEDLLTTNDTVDTNTREIRLANRLLGLFIYLLLAVGLAVVCLRYQQTPWRRYEPDWKGGYYEPKYLSWVIKPTT